MNLQHRVETVVPAPELRARAARRHQIAQGTFDRDFEIDVLALMCRSKSFLYCVCDLCAPESFDDPVLGWFFATIRDHFRSHGRAPSEPALWAALDRLSTTGEIQAGRLCEYVEVLARLRDPRPAQHYDVEAVVAFCMARRARHGAKRRAMLG